MIARMWSTVVLIPVLSVVFIKAHAQEAGPYRSTWEFMGKDRPDVHIRIREDSHRHDAMGEYRSRRDAPLFEGAPREGSGAGTPGMASEAWARHYGSGLLPAAEQTAGIGVDSLGCVYVTGVSTSAVGSDCVTLKYTSSGDVVWSARYDGSRDDGASALKADAAGNVYVVGWSVGAGTGSDFITIRYDAAGNEQWVSRYNGPDNRADAATSVAVDASGNVYVAGHSRSVGTGFDCVTIKYSPTGNALWVARFGGEGDAVDVPRAIAVDTAGNVFVTGASSNPPPGLDYDIVTIKYNPDGVEEWVRRYDGPSHDADYASDVALDGTGNVYVTGQSRDAASLDGFVTIKYSSTGSQLWAARYDGPAGGNDRASAMGIDAHGNILVTGNSDGHAGAGEFAILKYSPSGHPLWVLRESGEVSDLAVDHHGNVCVAGSVYDPITEYDLMTMKVDPSGTQVWVSRYNGPANSRDRSPGIAVDAAGRVSVAGTSTGGLTDEDYATVQYGSDGVQQWTGRFDGEARSYETARAMTVDASGNVYVAGHTRNADTSTWNNYAFVTIKYDAAGVLQWAARYDGPGGYWDAAYGIAVDLDGNVYVTGESYRVWGDGNSTDYATVKYNSAGEEQWVARYDGSGGGSDGATAITTDKAGNVYVTGSSTGPGTAGDFATIKYNADGVAVWVARYNGPASGWDEARAIAVDTLGTVHVTGRSVGVGTSYDIATVTYDSAGMEQWVARYDGPAHGWDEPVAVAVDGSGRVHVAGPSRRAASLDDDYVAITYTPGGNQEWVARYDGPQNSDDYAEDMVVDAAGNVYVTGTSYRGTVADITTVKYGPTGVEEWVDRFNFRGNGEDRGSGITMDGSGNVLVTGWCWGWNSLWDYGLISYDPDGNRDWVGLFDGPGNLEDLSVAVAADRAGNVYATGYSLVLGGTVITTLKYDRSTLSVEPGGIPPASFVLFPNYPNPFNPSTTVAFDIRDAAFVTLKVYDVLGREMATLVNEQKEPGTHRVEFNAQGLPSGMYVCRIQAGVFAASRKMVLLR